jgi:hypothetical protein
MALSQIPYGRVKPICSNDYEAAGDAAGLLMSLAAGLASVEAGAAGLASSDAEAEASGAGAEDSFLQAMAVAAKNIEIRPRIRNLRITSSFIQPALASRAFSNGANNTSGFLRTQGHAAAVSDFSKPCFACPSQDMQLSRFIAAMVAEVGKMKRSAVGQSQARVIEHELDMRRAEFSPIAASSRIGKFVRRLITGSNGVASPMRSVDRKLEDQYPSGNRQT